MANVEIKKYLTERGKTRNLPLNLNAPKTIQDKLNYIKVHPDNLPLMTRCSDKIKVHDYCEEKTGKRLQNEIYQIGKKAEDIDFSKLPNSFVIKCNHGSSFNIIVRDKSKVDITGIKTKVNRWLKTKYGETTKEINYFGVERRVFVERIFPCVPVDYKFWCFNGEPRFCTANWPGDKNINHYDLDFNLLPYSRSDHPADPKLKFEKPIHFEEMKEYAKTLSEPFRFVRVDFYEIEGELLLGEMTFFPGAAFLRYNGNYGIEIGKMLNLKKKKQNSPYNMYKKCVYTAVFGGYDCLEEIEEKTEGYDYICFTDSDIKSNTWKIVKFTDFPCTLDNTRKNRYVKINPHILLPEYDMSVYVDANVKINGDMDEFLTEYGISSETVFSAGKHPNRKCIYEESKVVVRVKKDAADVVNKQMSRYESEGYPKNNGLTQNCILIRFHNDEWCKSVMGTWWNEVLNGSKRDQLSLYYSLWKHQEKKINVLPTSIFNCKYLKWGRVHKKQTKTVSETAKMVTEKPKETKTVEVTRKTPVKRRQFSKINTSLYNFRQ